MRAVEEIAETARNRVPFASTTNVGGGEPRRRAELEGMCGLFPRLLRGSQVACGSGGQSSWVDLLGGDAA